MIAPFKKCGPRMKYNVNIAHGNGEQYAFIYGTVKKDRMRS